MKKVEHVEQGNYRFDDWVEKFNELADAYNKLADKFINHFHNLQTESITTKPSNWSTASTE